MGVLLQLLLQVLPGHRGGGLGGGLGDGVDVWPGLGLVLVLVVLLVRNMLGRPHREVVLQVANRTGVVGETKLLGKEWVADEWLLLELGPSSCRQSLQRVFLVHCLCMGSSVMCCLLMMSVITMMSSMVGPVMVSTRTISCGNSQQRCNNTKKFHNQL